MAPSVVSDIELPAQIPETAITPGSNAPSFKLFSLEGKTVAITGGGRGLGITLALAVVEAGGNVACLDILEEPSPSEWAHLNKVAKAGGRGVSYRRCDVTDEAAVEQAVQSIESEAQTSGAVFWGTIACAGIQQQISAFDYPAADFDRILRVNVTGVFNTCKYTARALRDKKRPGSIVIISSMSGNIANRVSTIICMVRLRSLPNDLIGLELHCLQLEQGRCAANVPIRGPGMGSTRHSREHALSWCEYLPTSLAAS
jgi:NAD(P)-dependent dehydrogenase (short-subunit alcohol dehydrogenase family)